MERTLYTSNRLDIALIPAIGFAIGYEHKYKEVVIILGCFLCTIEFKRKKRKHGKL